MHPNKEIALRWFDAFNQHHLENLLALYHEDAEHFSPKLKIHRPETAGLIKGKSALRSWWANAFQRLPQLHYSIVHIMADNDQVFMEYIRQSPGEEDLHVGEVLIISEGKIMASRVYHS